MIGDADNGVAASVLKDAHVAWTPYDFGTDSFQGWLRYLANNADAQDLAVVVAPVGSRWSEEELEQARQRALDVPCKRVLIVSTRGVGAAAAEYADMLQNIGETRIFGSPNELAVMLADLIKPYAGTAPPAPPPPPRVTTAGVRRSGVADVATGDDSLGFEPYVKAVAAFLAHPQTAVPLTMSIEGPWGAGKSSFMLQLEKELAAFKTIRFNAWRHEKAEELWAAFALHFIEKIKPDRRPQRWRADAAVAWKRFDLRSGWPDLLRIAFWFLALAAATITLVTMTASLTPDELQKITGGKDSTLALILGRWFGPALGISGWFVAAGALTVLWQKFFGHVKSPLEIDLRKYLKRPDYEGKLSFIERFQEDLKNAIDTYVGEKSRIFVFIDDLDRCELPQAAELMRAINLMLSDTGAVVFIIGMDREKVAAALAVKNEKLLPFLSTDAPQLDGSAAADSLRGIFFGYEFIEKFIQIPFAVPEPSELNLDKFLSSLAPSKAQADKSAAKPDAASAQPAAAPATPQQQQPPPPQTAPLHEFVRPLDEESANLLEIARKIAPALGNNPRRVKQFVNLFRLRVIIAFATDLFVAPEDTPPAQLITLEKIAKFIAIELRWPLLIEHAQTEPGLLGRLEQIAIDKRDRGSTVSYRVNYWSRYAELMTLLQTGWDMPAADDWRIGEIDLSRLTNVSVKKARPEEDKHPGSLATALTEIDGLDRAGRHDEAITRLLALEPLATREPQILQRLGYHYLWSDPLRALEYSFRYIAVQPTDPSGPFNAACAASQLGRRNEALDFLRRAIQGNSYYMERAAELMKDDFSPLANDPEFLALIGRSSSAA